MSDTSFVFAVSEVKEDTGSLVLGCMAAAAACTASLPADHSSTGGEITVPFGAAFTEIFTFVSNDK